MSPELSWLLLMAGMAAVAVGVDKLVNARDSLRRTVADPSRFDVFGDDEPAGHYDGAEWDESTPLYDQMRDDLDWQAWEAEVSA